VGPKVSFPAFRANLTLFEGLSTMLAQGLANSASPALIPWWVWLVLSVAGLVASVTDLRRMIIPNWLTIPLILGGLAYGGLTGGWSGLGAAAIGVAVGGAVFVFNYATSGGGAGDAKLMMGMGGWIGWEASLTLILCVTVVGLFAAIYATVRRGGIKDVPYVLFIGGFTALRGLGKVRSGRLLSDLPDNAKSVPDRQGGDPPMHWYPYAPSIFIGTLLAWWVCASRGGLLRW
jgi:Flp pilus assembly protein protease CpaA